MINEAVATLEGQFKSGEKRPILNGRKSELSFLGDRKAYLNAMENGLAMSGEKKPNPNPGQKELDFANRPIDEAPPAARMDSFGHLNIQPIGRVPWRRRG